MQQAELIRELQDTIAKLTARIAVLENALSEARGQQSKLQTSLDQVNRQAHRQAAPFRISENKRKSDPKKPGPKKGHPGIYRATPSHIDETIDVALEKCPQCGGPLADPKCIQQIIEECPRIQLKVIRLRTYKAHCPYCGEVRSHHPLQVSEAVGAAGVHLGPRALGITVMLNKALGTTVRKTCRILQDLLGLRLTPGGLTQLTHRFADKFLVDYQRLLEGLRTAPVVHCDETSWWVGGPKFYLWVLANVNTTVYRVTSGRGRNIITDTLGADFPGVLVSDCLNIYDDATPLQQKCYSHHLKAISEAMEQHPQHGEGFLMDCQFLLHTAMIIKKIEPRISPLEYADNRSRLERLTDKVLGSEGLSPTEEKIRARLLKQRDHLFTFLYHDGVDATNNLAERQLRPAVIARKVSCGNRTLKGKRTWEILVSVAATMAQRSQSFLDAVADRASLLSKLPIPDSS
jgi:transposase